MVQGSGTNCEYVVHVGPDASMLGYLEPLMYGPKELPRSLRSICEVHNTVGINLEYVTVDDMTAHSKTLRFMFVLYSIWYTVSSRISIISRISLLVTTEFPAILWLPPKVPPNKAFLGLIKATKGGRVV